jgi:hypothetical protein
MNVLEGLITKNISSHPELVEYRDIVIKFTEEHRIKRPDMCIEGCKSLIEGLSKFIYFQLKSEDINEKRWKDYSFSQKYNLVVDVLNLDSYEDEFARKNSPLIHKLGEIRNERGDISHGQSYPKDSYSNHDFVKFIILWTEGVCYFLLANYITIKQKEKETADIYSNEQFEEFNNYLDDLYPEVKLISYSKALKEQDPLQYELQMDDYYERQ